MRSIQRRFSNIQKKNPNLSSYMQFAKAIKGENFSKDTIARWFKKLVDEEDYLQSDKRHLIKHLVSLSNTLVEH